MRLTRRGALIGGTAGVVGAGLLARPLWDAVTGPDLHIPDVPEGDVRLERVRSDARGQAVDLFTAVPDGHGDGAGLPVCLVLHGATNRPDSYRECGLPQLLTSAVRAGAPPFVLAGADGGAQKWERVGSDDPSHMLTDELPGWLAERGFDTGRLAAWGWSMGGYGALRHAELRPDWLRAVAAFSPAVQPGDAVFSGADALAGQTVGVWCGTEDPLVERVVDLIEAIPGGPDIASTSPGEHTMEYWTRQAEDAFLFVGEHLSPGSGAD